MLLFGSDTEAATLGEICHPLPVQQFSLIDDAVIFAIESMRTNRALGSSPAV